MWGRRRRDVTAEQVLRGDRGVPDAKVTELMRLFAAAFVRTYTESGRPLGWDAQAVAKLDDYCEEFLAEAPPEAEVHSMAAAMGAFLGEVIVRNGGGRWTSCPGQGPGILTTERPGMCLPVNKVGKQLTIGPEHSISVFFDAVMSGANPPGAAMTPREP